MIHLLFAPDPVKKKSDIVGFFFAFLVVHPLFVSFASLQPTVAVFTFFGLPTPVLWLGDETLAGIRKPTEALFLSK